MIDYINLKYINCKSANKSQVLYNISNIVSSSCQNENKYRYII